SHAVDIGVQIFFTIGVVVLGKMLLKMKVTREEKLAADGPSGKANEAVVDSGEAGEANQDQSPVTEEEK
ncbi:hypothetical protein MUP29_04920, partial [bacterium]|nr:hypothetical protein [bacterium]